MKESQTYNQSSLLIHKIFEAQEARAPNTIAVAFEEQTLSYSDLNQAANRVANRLIEEGIKPDQLVGILAERSLELIIGILGILKAGAAYVPFDPEYPTERLTFMIEDTRIPVMLTRSMGHSGLPDGVTKYLSIEEISRSGDDANPCCDVVSQYLAYVIYTSGSTGKPKGVMVTHGNITRLFQVTEDLFQFDEKDVWTLFHSPAFDFSVWEMWGALLYGGKLLVIPYAISRSPDLFYELLSKEKVTVLNQTPSAFKQLLAVEEEGSKPLSLRYVIFGGEALHPSILKEWFDRHGDQHPQMVNMYGITETTVHVTYRPLKREDTDGGHSVIGVPLNDLEVHLLDEKHHPVPIGTPGEMYVSGPGVARGYLNRPELTAERFIQNPHDPSSADRWYRSGDLARRIDDGSLEYLGRIDKQVKIRGFRIELGEIEAVLSEVEGIAQAAVIACEEVAGDQRLIAYVVPHKGKSLEVQSVHAFLKTRLPVYMVPSALVVMDSLPLNANGKLDVQALPAPERQDMPTSPESIRASTPEEEAVIKIWRELLRIDDIGVNDNFFELGGHSLLAARLISRMRAVFGIDLPVCDVFELPTVRQLAARVFSLLGNSGEHQSIPKLPENAPLPLSFAQHRLWFLHRLQSCSAAYNLPTATVLGGVINIPALEGSLNEIIRRHSILRARFPAENDGSLLNLIPNLHIPIPVIDLSALSPEESKSEMRRLMKEDALLPFDLENGPLIRASILQRGPTDHVLLLNVHHMVADGWSLNILFKEWTALYGAFCQGIPSHLPPLPIQYADYAAWQRASLRGEDLERQLAYWKKQLQGLPIFELPTDYPRKGETTYEGGKQVLTLLATVAEPIYALGKRENTTLFMTLLAVFKLWLFRCTRQTDICVGTPIAMRNRVELEHMVGFFINTLVLRTKVSEKQSFRELLRQVRITALGAYAHQDVPFEKLVEELNPDRSLGRTPLFQIFFNLLNYEKEQITFPGLCTHRIPNVEATSKFDLTLYVTECKDGSIRFTAVYNRHLFRADRIANMLQEMEFLLQQIAANPDKSLESYSLVTLAAKSVLPDPTQPIIAKWEGSVQEHFELQASRRAGHLAVFDDSGGWTYRELQSAANALAHRLISSGCKHGDLVAIYAHRSRPLISTLLGVLKTGAAFLVLDPAYPASRLVKYLQVAKPRGFLQLEAAGGLPCQLEECVAGLRLSYRLTIPCPVNSASPLRKAPAIPIASGDVAYVTFTSGSTGEPKAISGTHQPLVHFLKWHVKTFDLQESDRFSLLSGLSHDPLLRDIFTPLIIGATLVIPTDEQRGNPMLLDAWLRENEVGVVHWTPAMEQFLAEAPFDKNAPLPLRYAFFGGDSLTRRHLISIHNRAPRITCVNFYGASETPQAMSYNWADPDAEGEKIPLGHGIDGVQLLVLNPNRQLAGIGEPGEIFIRTPYLSQGYLSDEALTHTRFLTNPFTNVSSDTMYRTGDMGCYREDGSVEFLGRIDRQIKIRGFRLEPAELESQLAQHPLVLEAHVRLAGQPEPQLTAYIVLKNRNGSDPSSALRTYLRERLPSAMIPSAFVIIPAIPLTPNGKVDSQRLPTPALVPVKSQKEPAAPEDALEYQLQKIWEDLLQVSPIGIQDNFFDLGGHSLLAARLFAQIKKLTGCNLPLAALFQSPTIKQLAELIRNGGWEPLWSTLVPIQPNGTKPPLFLVHPVGGNVLGYHDLSRHLDKDLPVFGLQALGLRGAERPLKSVSEMAEHYLKEIRALRPHGPYLLVGYSSGGIVAYEMAQQLHAQKEEIALLSLLDTAPSGSWKKPVPTRIAGHVHVLMQLPWSKKWSYVAGKFTLLKQRIQTALKLRALSVSTVPAASPEVLDNVRMSNRRAILKYRPTVYPGRVILFRATLRHDFYHEFTREPDESWRKFAGGGLVIRNIPGDHGQMLGEPNVALVACELQQFINEAATRHEGK